MGVPTGGVIAAFAHNRCEHFVSHLAATSCCIDNRAPLVVCRPTRAEMTWTDLFCRRALPSAAATSEKYERQDEIHPDDPLVYICTLGTIGPSKGVLLTHKIIPSKFYVRAQRIS